MYKDYDYAQFACCDEKHTPHRDGHVRHHHPLAPGMFMPLKLARAYVPYQMYGDFFPLPVGFRKGTIFADLWRPYVPKRK